MLFSKKTGKIHILRYSYILATLLLSQEKNRTGGAT